jgi:putative addiction module component (TIGR02574 family)
MSLREEIARQALSLAPEDRVYLADILEQSLTNQADFARAEIDAAWSAEIDRRMEAYDRGEAKGVDFETALAQIQQHLADHRRRKVTS